MKKHYGIPYMGSKAKILHLIHYIFEREHDKEYFIEPFCGGLSVTQYALEHTRFKVLANDLNHYVITLYREIIFNNHKELEKVWYEWVSRKKFNDVRDNPAKYPNWYVGFVLCIWSFGNNQHNYLFGKDIEEYKKLYHQTVVDQIDKTKEMATFAEKYVLKKHGIQQQCELFMPKGFTPRQRRLALREQLTAYKNRCKNNTRLGDLRQLERLERLQQLEQLERLRQLERLERLQQLQLYNMDWNDFVKSIPDKILQKAFIYCDPPYENTGKYQIDSMNYDQFWNWFRSCPYPVYVSSYTAPEDIQPIRVEHKYVLFSPKNTSQKAQENIYWNGVGLPAPGTLLEYAESRS